MRSRNILYVAVGVVVLLAAIVFAVNRPQEAANSGVLSNGPSGPVQATPIHHYGAESGTVSDALISPDNVTFRIVTIQRGTTRWLFHIHAHNSASHAVSILNTGTDHYFMIGGKGLPGTPYTNSQIFLKLTPVGQADLAAHPALTGTVGAGADSDGWLVADLTNFHLPPFNLLYVYGTVTAPSCTNPADQSTCHPSTGYRTLVWQL